MPFSVVTDSSCDLSPELARSLNVTVVPCNIHFGEETFRDGVDLGPEQFYQKLAGPVHPKTSQPSVESFLEGWRSAGGQEMLSLHLSSKLSATFNTAKLAKEQMQGGQRIEVVDSKQVSLGLGVMVIEAARMAKAGASLKETVDLIEREKGRVASYVSVDTLEYLVKGGRASKIQGFLGSLLNIKPIIGVKDDGEVHPVGRVRTRRKMTERLVEMAGSQKLRALGVLHSVCPDEAEALAASCAAFFPREKIVIAQFSAVLGTHVGPRALGVVLWPE